MKISNVIRTVNYHIGGEEYCFITDGIPTLRGKTMSEKMEYMRKNHDNIRKFVMRAPRGHRDMFGAVITEPVSDNAHCGTFYMGAITDSTYYPMCGSATIALATMLVNNGIVKAREPITEVIIDTPVGQVKCQVQIEDGKAVEVTFTNVPAFIYKRDLEIETEAFGKFKVDIGFGGGSFCVFVDMDKIDSELDKDKINEMVQPALEIISTVGDLAEFEHPENEDINSIDSCMFCDYVGDDGRELLVLGKGLVGRCPSGTGTPVRMIREYEKGNIELGEKFIQKSMIDTCLKGKLVKETKVGNLKAFIAEVSGRAYMTGTHLFFLEEDDPLPEGYVL